MKKYNYLAIVAATFIIASCSASKVMLNPEYEDEYVSAKNVAIVIQDTNPVISYNANTKLIFGEGNKDSIIWNFYKEKLTKQIKQKLNPDEIFFDDISQQIYSTMVMVNTKNASYEIKIPTRGTKLNFESGKDADLVFVIDQIGIGTELSFNQNAPVMGANGMMYGGGMSVKKELVFRSDFLLWDNLRKRVVSYGHLEANASAMIPIITKLTWENVSSEYIGKMISKVKFQPQNP